jgi:hypothetical protein
VTRTVTASSPDEHVRAVGREHELEQRPGEAASGVDDREHAARRVVDAAQDPGLQQADLARTASRSG